ncbi:MAG: Sec63 Brl domain-containing protein [Benjaminiella poitrasii]|nr:MAG: Sec63 Brl domain-containing protein [Benjaminiella poitrasii]
MGTSALMYGMNSEEQSIEDWLAQEEESLDNIDSPSYFQSTGKLPSDSQNIPTTTVATIIADSSSDSLQQQIIARPPLLGDTELRSTGEIPPPFNSIFKFGFFNKIQSKCLNDAFYENNNLVISAPTGSGKTAVLELAIIRTLLHSGTNSKIIYMAPTKSLCSERVRDWQNKFKPFDIECKEFTGDTHNNTISTIRKTTIIVTTPEKWDSMTRRWVDHRQLMRLINLFLIDEVHILNEKRGACLEACVSRMKTMDNNELRFIAVSATVPNLNDIATWLNAKPISFSEEYRPIRLDRFVYGYPQHEENMFLFDRRLDWKLLDMIQKHSNNKSVLIFCSTRKSAEQACNIILKIMDKKGINSLCETRYRSNHAFKNKSLPKLIEKGVAFHHAGLDPGDRSQIETLFSNRQIRVIATTSTLAIGVNLPAHLVIVKSTLGYQNGGLTEYSDIDLLQMIGRAGRPGLDTSGCVVIMTTLQMERRYKSLISGTTNLESRLHENLIEHLMSEICLRTIVDESSALKWLRSTFLYVRLTQNPIHYKLSSGPVSSDNILQEICVKDLNLLKENNLLQISKDDQKLVATPYGLAMDRYYIKFPTMLKLLRSENPNSVRDILDLLSECYEEIDKIRFNSGEKQFLSTLKNHASIRFPLSKVSSMADKISMLLQCVLGDISLYNGSGSLLAIESLTVMDHLSRITKCLIDCCVQERNPIKLKYTFEFYQSLKARLWSISPYIARQIDGIGTQLAKNLAQANLISFDQLRQCDPGRLEMILHRNPPFGTKIKKQIDAIPIFVLNVKEKPNRDIDRKTGNTIVSVSITLGIENAHIRNEKHGKKHYVQFWLDTSERELIDFRRIQVSKLQQKRHSFDIQIELRAPSTNISCHLQSENYVGIDVQKDLMVNEDPRKFITVLGQSNVMNHQQPSQNNGPHAEENDHNKAEDDVGFEDDDKIDPQLWNELAVVTTRAPTTNMDNYPTIVPHQEIDLLNNEKTKKKQQQKKSVAPCKHICKDKEKCAHKCCKRSLSLVNKNELKRKADIDENDDITFPSLRNNMKRLKTGNDESETTFEASPDQQSTGMEIEGFPLFSERDMSILGLSQPDDNVHDNNKNKTIKVEEDNDEDMFVDLFDFDNASFDSIVQSAILESKMSHSTTNTTNSSLEYRKNNDITYNEHFTKPESPLVAHSEPIITCDQLWDQVGEISQRAFENFHSTTHSQCPENRKENDREADNIQNKRLLAISYNNQDQLEGTQQLWQSEKQVEFKSSSLSEWIKNNVEVIR